jgi:hypothetical protein
VQPKEEMSIACEQSEREGINRKEKIVSLIEGYGAYPARNAESITAEIEFGTDVGRRYVRNGAIGLKSAIILTIIKTPNTCLRVFKYPMLAVLYDETIYSPLRSG